MDTFDFIIDGIRCILDSRLFVHDSEHTPPTSYGRQGGRRQISDFRKRSREQGCIAGESDDHAQGRFAADDQQSADDEHDDDLQNDQRAG